MHPNDHYVALRQWADDSAFQAADEVGTFPVGRTEPLGGVVALRMATDLLWLCVADAGDLLGDDADEALAKLVDACDALDECIGQAAGRAAGHCDRESGGTDAVELGATVEP